MIKSIKYFFEAFFIYLFFLISKIMGLSLSRKFFSFLFRKIGPIVRSNSSVLKNINNFPEKISLQYQKEIISSMWSNYGMTFVEYIFLNKFRKEKSHIEIKGENILPTRHNKIFIAKTKNVSKKWVSSLIDWLDDLQLQNENSIKNELKKWVVEYKKQ